MTKVRIISSTSGHGYEIGKAYTLTDVEANRLVSVGAARVLQIEDSFAFSVLGPPLVNGQARSLFQVRLEECDLSAGSFEYAICVLAGENVQALCGTIHWTVVNKGGGDYTVDIHDEVMAHAVSDGSLSAEWELVEGADLVVMTITPTCSLSGVSRFEIFYTFKNLAGPQAKIL